MTEVARAGKMAPVEVFPGVHSLPYGKGEFTGVFPPNVYLVAGERAALIDSGYGDEAPLQARLDFIRGYPLGHILVSHAHVDHIGGAAAIQAATGARLWLHPLEKGEADGQLGDGNRFELGGLSLEVLHTPGHTPGHCCFLLRERGVLFSGDHILGLGTTVITPPQGDMSQYMDSLRKLLSFPMEAICPGHGPLIRRPEAKIRELLQHRQEREGQVLVCLGRGIGDIAGIVRELYAELDHRLEGLAQAQVRAHLVKLVKEGRVREVGGSYLLV